PAAVHQRAGGMGRRGRREHGALRHRGDRHGQARRARHRPAPARRRSRRQRGRTRRGRPGQHRDFLPSEAGPRRRDPAARRAAAGQRRRGAARAGTGTGTGRGRALLFLRHLHRVRQLLLLLPRPGDPAGGAGRLPGAGRLLQGLRHLRQGMPDRLDDDAGGTAMTTQTAMLLSGNHAVAWAARLARPKVVPVYPITPQTPILELITDFHAEGNFDAEIITPESEHSVLSACIPASLAGARVFTATASQGLLLMHELLHYASGARAPIVMANVNRTVASPWAFWPDQTDSLAQRDTGWIQFYSESAQESLDTVLHGFRIAEQVMLPIMINHDAFYVSHALEPVQVPSQE